jgi:hypothetical protein
MTNIKIVFVPTILMSIFFEEFILDGGWAWVRLGEIKCAAICVGLCVGLQLFLFCEALAF